MFCHDKKVGMDLMETKQWSTQKNIAQTVQLSRHRECALCLEKFKSPRILPCFHTFCLKCLTDLVKIQQRQDTFCCPTCRATTQVPPGGVDKFQVNFYLEAEIDALSLKNDLICETCTRGAAAHKCFECNQLMCESCNRSHSSFPATKCRTVLSLNDTAGSTHVIKRERYCEKHPQEVIRFFCQQCRAVICRDCKLTFHEGHPTVDLSAKAASAKELLSEVCNVFINSLQPKLEEELQEATNHKMALPKKVAEIRAVLTKKAEDIKKVVDKSLNEALAKLEQDAQEVNNEVDEAVKEMERQLTRCQSLMEHAGCLAQSGVDADVLALPSQLASFFGSGDCASSSNNSAGFSKNRCSLPFYSGQQISAAYQNPSCLIAFTNSKWCSSLQYSQVDQFPQQVFYGHQQQTETGWNELAGRVGGYIGTTQKMQLPGEDKRMKVRKHRGQRSPSVPSRYFAGQSLSNPSILADIGNVNQLLARWQIANPQFPYTTNGYAFPVDNSPQADYSPPSSSSSAGLPNNNNSSLSNNSVGALPYQTTVTSPATSPPHPVALVRAVDLMDPVTLGNAISEAHLRTCLYTSEQIEALRQQSIAQEVVDAYRSMNHRQLWVELADKITMAVQHIIEFAKMIPGFMDLSQDDQIMLLKAGSFELALLQACRVFDPLTSRIIFGDHFLPLEVFANLNDDEKKLMSRIFEFIKSIQTMAITETEMALLSALILISADRPGVKEVQDIQKLHEKILAALKIEIGNNHTDDQEILARFIMQATVLRTLSSHHIHILNRFKESAPDVNFPALHKELFSIDTPEAS